MESDREKSVSWGLVLVIAGLVFFVIALMTKTPAVSLVALALVGAGAVTQFVSSRRSAS